MRNIYLLTTSVALLFPITVHSEEPTISSMTSAPACHKPREDTRNTRQAVKIDIRTSTCLISTTKLPAGIPIIDIRSREEFNTFHIPGASNQQLTQLLNQRPMNAIIYDGGRLSQDSMLLCERLQRYGLNGLQVIEGGIAAWSQAKRHPRAMEVSQLNDNEITSALLSGRYSITSLSPGFQSVLASLPVPQDASTQELILASSSSSVSAHLAQRRGGKTSLHWIGEPLHLQTMLQTLLAQDQKRELGPGHSPNCSAL